MNQATYVPSLSQDGWVNDPAKMGDILLTHFFVSDYSQTQIYTGNVASLPYLIQQYQNNLTGLFSGIETTLNTYLSRYVTNVVVEVQQYPNPTGAGAIGIELYVSYVGNDGKTYTLSNLIEILNSRISSIIKLNNNG